MRCLCCNQEFYVRRKLNNLFSGDTKYICNKCKPKAIKIDMTRIIVEQNDIDIYIVGDGDSKKYAYDYAYLLEIILNRGDIVILYDFFCLNDSTYNIIKYHIMANPNKKIVIICHKVKI